MTETVQRENMKTKEFEMKTSTSQKIGSAIFAIGTIYMFGLGWLY